MNIIMLKMFKTRNYTNSSQAPCHWLQQIYDELHKCNMVCCEEQRLCGIEKKMLDVLMDVADTSSFSVLVFTRQPYVQ